MATEEEAREAIDGKDIQVEAVDLEPVHMQTSLDGKPSSMEIKEVGEIIDSTEGKMQILEDHVLVEAPPKIKLPPEHNLYGTSSLNGHMDEEYKISNEQLHEDDRKDEKQAEAALDGESTDQCNKINQEVNDSLNHGETTTEDSSFLKHEKKEEPKGEDQQDEDSMHESDVHQLDQILDPAKATEEEQLSNMANIPDVEAVAEAPVGVQTPVDLSLDNSDAIPETDEPAKENSYIHLDHKESFPEDASIAEHTEEEAKIKVEDQESKQADTMDADVVQKDISKCEETGAPVEMSKSEYADESTIEAQEVFNQEPSEETNGPMYEKAEQTSKQSTMAASGDTTLDHDARNIEVQNKESLEEMEDAEAVDPVAAMQQRAVAFEEVIPEYHVETTEQDSVETNCTETAETHSVKTAPSSKDHREEDDVTAGGSTSGSQEVDNVPLVDGENKEKNMLRNEDIADKHMRGIKPEDTEDIEHVETEEDSDQRHVSLLDDSAKEDNTPVCEKQLMESASEINETEANRTEAVPEESNINISEEPSPEDYVTEHETTCDNKEVDITKSLEEIDSDKDTETREISYQSNMDPAGKSAQENSVPESEPTSDIQLQQDSEEMRDTELVQVSESSHEINATVFHKQTEDNNPTASELHVMESAGGVRNIEATKVQATPHQVNDDPSEEKTTEETITSTKPQTLEPESVVKMNDIVATEPQSISQQSIISPSEESVTEEIAKEDNVNIQQDDGHQQPQDLKLAELNDIETNKYQEIASSSIPSNSEEPISEDNAIVSEPSPETQAENLQPAEVNDDAEYVKRHGALAAETVQEENVETEATVDISPLQGTGLEYAKKTEPVGTEDSITLSDLSEERIDRETVETEAIPHESLIESTIEVTEKDSLTATYPHVDIQPVLEQESVEDVHTDTTEKARETQQIDGSASVELTPTEDNTTIAEPACDTALQGVVIEPSPETQENIQSAEVIEVAEYVKSHGALATETAQEENVETEAIVETSPVQEPELEEAKKTEQVGTEDSITPSDLSEERMDRETVETEAIPHERLFERTIEVTEKDSLTATYPQSDIQPILEQESVEDVHTDTIEKARETQQIDGSASFELTPTEDNTTIAEPACDTALQDVVIEPSPETQENIQSAEVIEVAECVKSHGALATETAQEENVETEAIVDTPPVQEPELEEAKKTEPVGTEDSTTPSDLSEERMDRETVETEAIHHESPTTDCQHVHQYKPAEVRDNEVMETEEVSKQSSIDTPENAPEERSEPGHNSDCYVQPAQQVESSRDSEDSKLLKADEMSYQKVVTLEDTITEDSVADESDPSVGENDHELESVEEIKDISVNEAKGDFHTGQPDTLDKVASEDNIPTTAATDNIQQLSHFKTEEMDSTEGNNNGDISYEQTKTATSVDPSPTDNEIASGEHPVEPHEENLGNETDNTTVVHGMKHEIQTSVELKDDAFELGETVPTTKKSNTTADEDVNQSFGEDKLEISNSNYQIKEEQKTGIEHNSSQISSEHHGENVSHVQDKDIDGELVTETGTAEASQAVIGNDSQALQDVTEKDDTAKSDDQTGDKGQSVGVEHQLQTFELSVEDEAVQKFSLDERHNEDEEVESKKEQVQADEQKHKDTRDDVTIEPLVESKNTENGTTNRTEETNTFEAEQTEAVVKEIVENEQALHTSEESTPSITVTTDDYEGMVKRAEKENRPNSANTSEADAKMDNQKEQENTGKDNIAEINSNNEQDETTNELEPDLASSVQEISHTAPSNDHILENDPIAVPHNVESGEHSLDKDCINKINDDVFAIQESEKVIVAEVREMQNEDKAVHQAESQIKAEEEEMSQLHFNEPYNVDNKMDDTTQIADLIQGNTTIQPGEIEERGENKGLSSISKPVVETSEQNNVQKDLSIHHKVKDGKLEPTEDNAVELEATEQKVDTSNADTSNDDQLPISNSLVKHETESTDDVLLFETEESASDKVDETVSYGKTEGSNTSAPETVTLNKEIRDKATETARGLSDESFKTFDHTGRNLDVSTAVTELNEESMNKKIEEHKLDLPAHPTQDENTPEQDMSLSEKPLPTEPEEQEDNQIPKEQDEEDMHETNIGDEQKEVEQDLPVSHFLMNLILGKENSNSNGHSEPEAETKKEETRDDNSSLIVPKQEESLAPLQTENNVEYKVPAEQEKKDDKCSEETHEVAEEQIHGLKLGIKTSLETDEEFNMNSHNSEVPPYQDNMKDKISDELLSEEAAEVVTKLEGKDIEISNIEPNERKVDTLCQENTEATTQIETGSLKNNLDDLINTNASEDNTLGQGQTGLLPECLNDDRSANAVSEQTLVLTESGIDDKISPPEAGSVQTPVYEIHDNTIGSFNIGATSTPDIQVESEEGKKEEEQPATTATGEFAEEYVEMSNDNPQKSIVSEATSDERVPPIAEQVSETEIALVHEKKISEGSRSAFMDEKEGSNVLVQSLDNIQTAVGIQADGSNLQISQGKQETADNQTEMEPGRLEESNIQELQENGTEQKSPKECDEEDQKVLVEKEALIKEEDVNAVESHAETMKIKSNEEQELSGSVIQERDLSVFSPKEAHEAADEKQSPKIAESFVDTAKPEFSADENQSPKAAESFVGTEKPEFSPDEEQSPKADEFDMSELKTYEGKTKDEEETKNFTDEAMKTEAQGAEQKAARKKQNLLSGIKHQLAKVKKVITGKPGHTKPESPKS